MAETRIEPAKPEMHEAIRKFLNHFRLPYEDICKWHLADYDVAWQGNIMIGVVGLERRGEFGLLRSLAVDRNKRGQGLGKALVTQVETRAKRQGLKTLFLLTSTAESFFAGLGYRVVQRSSAPEEIQETTEFKHICPESAICMQKRIIND